MGRPEETAPVSYGRRWWEAVDLPAFGAQGRLYRARRRRTLSRPRRVAFVLSGGGTLGAVQVGALRALVEHGIHADLVLGSSVGALNGAAYAHGSTLANVERIRRAWLTARDNIVFTRGRLWEIVQFVGRKQSVYETHGLSGLIDA
ncbi:MAG TPA: patatin-like phospholipase family protein, partial [Acidimicrobiales bacterium]|nr:patatin-like phospholipase family protein [Acidimicrobiales bacterium]